MPKGMTESVVSVSECASVPVRLNSSGNVFARDEQSLLFLSLPLFTEVKKEVVKAFPKAILWKDLFTAVGIAEKIEKGEGVPDLVLVAPREKRKRKIPIDSLRLMVDDIHKDLVLARIDLPLYGSIRQKDRAASVLLHRLGLSTSFSIRSGGIAVDVRLPFEPMEAPRYPRPLEAREGQRVFMCPLGWKP